MSNREGNSKMMMMAGLACVCCVSVIAIGAGYMLMNNKDDSKKKAEDEANRANALAAQLNQANQTEDSGPTTSDDGAASDIDGKRRIKYGSTSMVPPSENKCSASAPVFFENTQDNDQHAWNFDPVPGRPGYYYIRSERSMFKGGCPRYLTAPQNCNSSKIGATLEKARYADRQYWKAIPSGDGYQLVSVSCQNSRQFPYLISKGASSGKKNIAHMSNRIGATYSLEAIE